MYIVNTVSTGHARVLDVRVVLGVCEWVLGMCVWYWACVHGAGHACLQDVRGAGRGGCIALSGHIVIVVAVLWPCCHHCRHRGAVAVATGITLLSSLWCGLVAVTIVPWSHHHHLWRCCGGIAMVVGSQ